MEFIDTHCHIHFRDYELDPDQTIKAAIKDNVTRLICVGVDLETSQGAVEFVQNRPNCFAAIGIHPHEAKRYINHPNKLQNFRNLLEKTKVVAIGETGLDYYYKHSSKEDQKKLLTFQLDLAQEYNLPLIFHIREAFDDFWQIFDRYKGLKGVVHSFSATRRELDQILERGLYVGLNGIMTFTKDKQQLEAAKALPLQKLLLETDAPFLTPVPFRGTICEPKHVRVTASFLSDLRGEGLEQLAAAATQNARDLFNI